MSTLSITEKAAFERLLGMGSGYVSSFSDATFGTFVAEAVERDIHSDMYSRYGNSKAKKLRHLWEIEPDDVVANLMEALIDHQQDKPNVDPKVVEKCRAIVSRLRSSTSHLQPLKQHADKLDAPYLAKAIQRMEKHIDSDPDLAIGSAKELVETCCKTILSERGGEVVDKDDLSQLTKKTFQSLRLVPDGVRDEERGSDAMKQVLRSCASITQGLAEIRNLYGTGHGKHGKKSTLTPRHAKLAVGAAATLVSFLFETHEEQQ